MKAQIVELEKAYWHAMEAHDFETIKKLTRFPCIVAGKNGVQSVSEAAFKKMFDSGAGAKIKVMNIDGIETQTIADNTAVIAYLIEIGTTENEQGHPMKCACTSTWVKENNNWVCALHTEVELVSESVL
ncbi:MAG: nuclear transport factor 2 family protein [Chitinophagaceae bacterium]|nr:nuclear transport factor 2 family protein [Chitinophagaceae bacterium]